jgi:hypothetical protein
MQTLQAFLVIIPRGVRTSDGMILAMMISAIEREQVLTLNAGLAFAASLSRNKAGPKS